MDRTCSIIQPHYIPYMGYFDLFQRSDKIIILDDVQFVKREWKNRNKIRKGSNTDELKWLTVPVDKKDQKKNITNVKISEENNSWRNYHIDSIIFTYMKTPFFKKYSDSFFEIISDKNIIYLKELNMKLIALICKILKIEKSFYYSSDLMLSDKGVERLIKICKIFECNNYLANNKTIENYGLEEFEKEGINVMAQNYKDKCYNQTYNNMNLNWISNLSVIDRIFNIG